MVFVQLKKSEIDGKKYTAIFYDEADRKKIRTTHFGFKGSSTFIDHKDEQKKKAYIARHKVNENWEDYKSGGSLARYILWNKPTISASYNDYLKRFGLKKF